MFATILGALPRPPLPADASPDGLVAAAVEAQLAARLEPVSDGRLRWRSLADGMPGGAGPSATAAWRFTAAAAGGVAAKATLPGPYSLARARVAGSAAERSAAERRVSTLEAAGRIRTEALALAAAGCPFIEVEESEAAAIGTDEAERALFREAHLALADGLAAAHLCLLLVGPSADAAGIETILAAPYASLAVDLIDGPDDWRLVARTPGDRGIVAGAMAAREGVDDGLEILLYAARYAAATGGRGLARVGLATTPGLERLTWDRAADKLRRLGEAARLAALPPGPELAAAVDPRSIDIRSAGIGRPSSSVPRPRQRRSG